MDIAENTHTYMKAPVHSTLIFRSGIARKYSKCLSSISVQPRHWELEHSASDDYAGNVHRRFCPTKTTLDHRASDDYGSYVSIRLRSTKTLGIESQ